MESLEILINSMARAGGPGILPELGYYDCCQLSCCDVWGTPPRAEIFVAHPRRGPFEPLLFNSHNYITGNIIIDVYNIYDIINPRCACAHRYSSCRVCMCVCVCVYVCVTTHNCRLTHWNHKTEIPTCSQ